MSSKNNNENINTFSYDNCIVRNHDDSNDSLSSVFSWGLVNLQQMSTQVNETVQENETITEASSQMPNSVQLNMKEYFVLIVGILHKLEKYFKHTQNEGEEETFFKEYLPKIKEVLIQKSKEFGYDEVKKMNGSLYIREENVKKSQDLIRKQPSRKSKEHQGSMFYKETKMLKKMKINNETSAAKSKISVNGKPSKLSQNSSSNKGNNTVANVTSTFSSSKTQGQKRKKPQLSNAKSSKKARRTYVLYNEKLLRTTAKLHSTLSGENYNTVIDNLRESAGLPKKNYRERTENRRQRTETDPVTATVKHDDNANETKKHDTFFNKKLDKKTDTDKEDKLKSNFSATNGSQRKALYSPSKWLEHFSSIQD